MNNYSYNSYNSNNSTPSFSPSPYRNNLATPESRLVAYLLDAVLIGATFGVGWFIWLLLIGGRGTTPGHDLMGQKVVDIKTGETLTLGKMLLRECAVKGVLSMLIASFTFFLTYIIDGAFIFRDDRRTLHDHLLGTEVIQERNSAVLDKLKSF